MAIVIGGGIEIGGGITISPDPVVFYIATQNNEQLITEDGDNLVTEFS